jgi:ammonia channel protein AmtB
MVIFAFIVGGLFGTLFMTLFAAESYEKGFKDGAKWDE